MKQIGLYLIIGFCGMSIAFGQLVPPIKNFSPTDYAAGNQNWSISQGSDRLIYAANNDGLLVFNGERWLLLESPNNAKVRAVKVVRDRIYTGSYMDFGYWIKNPSGNYEYTSLAKKLELEILENEEFWTILSLDQFIIFHSLNNIYIYNVQKNEMKIISSDKVINKIFQVDASVYYQKLNDGIYEIRNGQESLALISDELINSEVVHIGSWNKKLLIVTKKNGLFVFFDGKLRRQSISSLDQSSAGIYCALRLSNGFIALGTISEGVIFLDQNLQTVYQVAKSTGLINNTILYLYEDVDANLWTGLDDGIAYVNYSAAVIKYADRIGAIGSVYAAAVKNGNEYLGTNQGLFYRSVNSSEPYRLIDGTQGQVWFLKELQNTLFCGHHSGTYLIDGVEIKKVSNVQGAWDIMESAIDENLLIQGNYDGLHVLENVDGNWKYRNKIKGFETSSRYMAQNENQILVNHEYRGVFTLTVDSDYFSIIDSAVDSSIQGANSGLVNFNDEILYAKKEGVYRYNKIQKNFLRDSLLSSSYEPEDYISGRMVICSDDLWFFTRDNLVRWASGSLDGKLKKEIIPISLDERNDVQEYENITLLNDESKFLVGTSAGYLIIQDDLDVSSFNVYVEDILFDSDKQNLTTELLQVPTDAKEIVFSFYVPRFFGFIKPTYQYKLHKVWAKDSDWNDLTDESILSFSNLPPDTYNLKVKAIVGQKPSENIIDINFQVLQPWYLRTVMLALYCLAIIVFSVFMHFLYRGYYRKEREKLIEQNRKDLELSQLQSEKEIIAIRNDQLKKEFANKSNEAAGLAMSIVKKNELLSDIKEKLEHSKSEGSVVPVVDIIDKNLNDDGDWTYFKEAFDNADQEFFRKLNDKHPKLSPNDLKLCAYLRLNLSSKEIAPLFNISPRSVEIKRYRLRKKLELSNNENLTNYILNI